MSAAFTSVVVVRPYQQVARQIEEQIRNRAFLPGQKLPTEREMGERFGVSRTVVREALKSLEAVGLVESRQGSGVYVRHNPVPVVSRALNLSVTPDDRSVENLFTFREGLEVHAASLAATRRSVEQLAAIRRAATDTQAVARDGGDFRVFAEADRAFHAAIRGAAGNPYLDVVLDAVRQMQIAVARLIARRPGSLSVAAEQHRRVAEAIAAGAADAAAAAMRAHVRYTAGVVREVLEVHPEAHPGRGEPTPPLPWDWNERPRKREERDNDR